MNVTRFTDYSLRVLIYLAIHRDRPATIREVAERYGISKNHLMKVVQQLSASGYVDATRGKSGGIQLAHEPEQINIGQLVRKLEQGSVLVECFGSGNQCVITSACQLKRMFAEALDSFFTTLENYTLADLVQGNSSHSLQQIFVNAAANS
jgi:Rrf2 family nitric oxide-sensitive transcriptional repressor